MKPLILFVLAGISFSTLTNCKQRKETSEAKAYDDEGLTDVVITKLVRIEGGLKQLVENSNRNTTKVLCAGYSDPESCKNQQVWGGDTTIRRCFSFWFADGQCKMPPQGRLQSEKVLSLEIREVNGVVGFYYIGTNPREIGYLTKAPEQVMELLTGPKYNGLGNYDLILKGDVPQILYAKARGSR